MTKDMTVKMSLTLCDVPDGISEKDVRQWVEKEIGQYNSCPTVLCDALDGLARRVMVYAVDEGRR